MEIVFFRLLKVGVIDVGCIVLILMNIVFYVCFLDRDCVYFWVFCEVFIVFVVLLEVMFC